MGANYAVGRGPAGDVWLDTRRGLSVTARGRLMCGGERDSSTGQSDNSCDRFTVTNINSHAPEPTSMATPARQASAGARRPLLPPISPPERNARGDKGLGETELSVRASTPLVNGR